MSSRQRGGRGGGRRVVTTSNNNGSTLNDRFTQLKRPNSNAFTGGLTARRNAAFDRSAQGRFSAVMLRRTGTPPRSTLPPTTSTFRGRGRPRGRVAGAFTGIRRGSSLGIRRPLSFRGRGRGGRGRGRGGKRDNVSRDDLDKDLDSYMGGSKKFLDNQLDQMQMERSTQ